jgi:hypothetical protein
VYYAASGADASAAGFDDSRCYEEIRRSVGERSIPMVQALRNEAVVALQAWTRKGDRVLY